MIDLDREKPLTLAQAAKLFPNRPNSATVWRWCTKGARGIKLDSSTIGGRLYTSEAAIQRFIESRTRKTTGPVIPMRTPEQRKRAYEKAMERLEAAGI